MALVYITTFEALERFGQLEQGQVCGEERAIVIIR